MGLELRLTCDECGVEVGWDDFIDLVTGRAYIDGQEAGQSVYLCAEHRDEDMNLKDCKRVKFLFSAPFPYRLADLCTKSRG